MYIILILKQKIEIRNRQLNGKKHTRLKPKRMCLSNQKIHYSINLLFRFFAPQYLTAIDQKDDCKDHDRNNDDILQYICKDCSAV